MLQDGVFEEGIGGKMRRFPMAFLFFFFFLLFLCLLFSSRMKEDHFWMAFLSEYEHELWQATEAGSFPSIHGIVEQELHKTKSASLEGLYPPPESGEVGQSEREKKLTEEASSQPADLEKECAVLKEKLRDREQEVQRLKAELEGIRGQTSSLVKPALALALARGGEWEDPASRHTGSWVIDPVAQSFFQLDEQVKGELRREKAKRLLQVESELAWIPMGDDLTAVKGKWSCCKEEAYNGLGKGCKP